MNSERPKLTSPREVRSYLQQRGLTPSKSMGQNFLIDGNIRDAILNAPGLQVGDRVIEVGPGLGVMTEGLLDRGVALTAIELDRHLIAHLEDYFCDRPELTLIHADATEVDWSEHLSPGPVHVISNLPYSVGSRILYDLAAPENCPQSITVMVQDDVALRICATANTESYGLLSIRMKLQYHARRIKKVPHSCFVPPPRIGSAVVYLEKRASSLLADCDAGMLESLLKHAFSRRRKQLGTILRSWAHPQAASAGAELDEATLQRRPETFSPEEWVGLTQKISLA